MSFRNSVASVAAAFIALAGLAVQSSASFAADAPSTHVSLTQPVSGEQVPAVLLDQPTVESSTDVTGADEQVAYPTLAAAVAAQNAAADNEELRCLAGAIYYESRGEPLSGQLAVAEVILNRAASGRFGGSVCDVVTQPGQFSFVRGGRVPDMPGNRDARTAAAVAKVALKDAWESDASDAMYFHARRVSQNWSRQRVAAIGNHVFYR
jgi:spore germination cell wall hydrolase CwlJ-like protein